MNQMIYLDTYQDRVLAFYKEKRGSGPSFTEAVDYDHQESAEAEEAKEWAEYKYTSKTRAHLAKELADRMFTGYGVAIAAGIDLDKAFDLVCASNMTKERTPEGKVRKGESYIEPDMGGALL